MVLFSAVLSLSAAKNLWLAARLDDMWWLLVDWSVFGDIELVFASISIGILGKGFDGSSYVELSL